MKRVLSEDSNCVDVGAHRGAILRPVFKFAPNGTHYAFEPIPDLYQDLVRSFPAARVYRIALSDKSGVATFHHVTRYPGYSGLLRRRYPSDNVDVRQIEVKQDTLDSVLGEKGSIDFMKIDVEGAELNVLKGAERTIQNNKPIIIFEHELGAVEQYGTAPSEIYGLLSDYGLSVSLLRNWLRNEKPLNRKDFVEHFERGTVINFMAYP